MNTNPIDAKLLIPERIWLEPEQIDQARAMSRSVEGEVHRWQTYLNGLGLLSLEQWLHQRLPESSIHSDISETAAVLYVEGFKLWVLAAEHFLDEVVQIPAIAINQLELVCHFYVVLEVLEEEAEVTVRGFLRHDQLVSYYYRTSLSPLNGAYAVPLAAFDPEPNHLLFDCRFLEPASIPLPLVPSSRIEQSTGVPIEVSSDDRASNQRLGPAELSVQQTRTKLTRWLEGAFEEFWQTIDTLVNPDRALILGTRNHENNIRRGKLFDLGVQLGNQTVALLITVAPEAENSLSVLVQLHPGSEAQTLPPHLKLTLLSRFGKVLQEVEARQHDSYIQLRSFRGELGKCFSLEISLGETSIREDFEL